jgi:hypothetical protein
VTLVLWVATTLASTAIDAITVSEREERLEEDTYAPLDR